MKKIIVILLLLLPIISFSQNIVRNGNKFQIVAQTDSVKQEATKFIYTDKNGKDYPIYIGKTGACYIWKTSRTGKQYKQYLGAEISKEICKELDREYKKK